MANIVSGDHETMPTNKHKNKHRKHPKDNNNLSKTEIYSQDLSTGNHVHINNEELNVIQKHKRIDFNAVQTCTVFGKTEEAPNKHKKKSKKDKSNLNSTDLCILLDNHDTISDATCRKKGKENGLTTNNAAVVDSYIRHKNKHKRKNSDLNFDEVFTHPINSELNQAAKQKKKHKNKGNCSNTEICTNSKELQITSHNLKSANKDCDSNEIESFSQHNNSGSNSATNNKNYKENPDLIPIANAVLDDNELIQTNKHTGNHLDINNIKLSDSEKHKKSDFNSAETCTVFDENETSSDKHKKKWKNDKSHSATVDSSLISNLHSESKDSGFTTDNNNAVFGELEIDSTVRHKKKHKKIKNNDLNCDEVYTYHTNSKLNHEAKKSQKHKKYKDNCNESNTENCTNSKELQLTSYNPKSAYRDCDLNKIESYSHNNNSELISTTNNKSKKENLDLNTVLKDKKLIPTNKNKKKHKRNEEKNYSNTTHALSTQKHINFNNIKLNDNKKHKERDFSIAQTCTIFDKSETTSNKHKKKKDKDKNHLAVNSSSLFNDRKTISSVTHRKKSKKSVLTTDNAAVFYELKTDSKIGHKEKHKKTKNSEINCDEVYTHPVYTELNHAVKKRKKHKKYKDNCIESNMENHTNCKELQTTSHNHKSATVLVNNKLIPTKEHKKKCKENNYLNTSDALSTENHLDDNNIELNESEKQKKSDFNSVQSCTVFDENKITFNKHKKKWDKDIRHSATINSCSISDDHEAISDVACRKKSKKSSLTTDDVTVFDEHKIDSNVRHKKKHKKRKYSEINCAEVDTHPEIVEKRKKHKKYKNNCDESNSGACTFLKERQIACYIQENKDCDSNNIKFYSHHNTLELSSSDKYVNDEKYPDSSTGCNNMFDDNEKIPNVKHKMKHQKNKERNCLNATDALSARNNLDIDNIELHDIEKYKKSDFNSSQTSTGVDKNETTPNKHKNKRKKDQSHFANSSTSDDLEIIYDSGFNNDNSAVLYELEKDCDITPRKKHKKRKDTDLNCEVYVNPDDSEINDTDKRKKRKYQGKWDDSNIEICSVFDDLEVMSYIHKNKNQKYDSTNIESSIICNNLELNYTNKSKIDKENPDFNTIADTVFGDNEIIQAKKHKRKHKRNKEIHLNTTDALSTVNHLDVKIMELNCTEKHESRDFNSVQTCTVDENETTHNKHKNKRKKDIRHLASNSCTLDNLRTTDVTCRKSKSNITDNSVIDEIEIIHDTHRTELNVTSKKRKKHKKNQDGYDESNIEACSKESQTIPLNYKSKHKDCDSNDVEASFDLSTLEFISFTNCKNDTESPDLNTLANSVSDDNEIIIAKKHKKKHKKNKENNYKITTETFTDSLSTKNYIDINNIESNVVQKDISSSTSKTFNAENYILAKFNEIDAHNNYDQPISHTIDNVEENTNEETNYCRIIESNNLTLCLDCNEDPVDFEVPPLHFETVSHFTEQQTNYFLSQGINIKRGKYTKDEDQIIKGNYENFAKTYGISDVMELFGIGRYGKNKEIAKFIKAKHFYLRLAKGLNNRKLDSIYNRARLLLHPLRNKDKLTEREITSIINAQRTVSNKWHRIGDALGRTAESCQRAYRYHGKPISKGTFTEKEKQQLIEAIRKVSGSSDLSCKKLKGISWDAVAACVPTRNFIQCRKYWAHNLAWKPNSAKKKWDNSCSCKLVRILSNEWDVESSSKIDWFKVYESFEDFAPSHIYVQKRWYHLRNQIPDYQNKSYRDIIRILCKNYALKESYNESGKCTVSTTALLCHRENREN